MKIKIKILHNEIQTFVYIHIQYFKYFNAFYNILSNLRI